MIVDVVLRLHMREALHGEALDSWLREMESRIETMDLVERANVAGDVHELAQRIAQLLNTYGVSEAPRFVTGGDL